MVSMDINNPVTAGAEELSIKNSSSQPSLQHDFIVQRVAVPVETFSWDRMQPLPGPTSRSEVQVSPAGEISLRRVAQEGMHTSIKRFGQGFLKRGLAG